MFERFKLFEKRYYRETSRKTVEISDPLEQGQIDSYMRTHRNLPPYGIAREAGYSSFVLESDKKAKINSSMLQQRSVPGSSNAEIISRLKDAPELPISCLTSAEHVIAMQNLVVDFVDEYTPVNKKQVMYQLLVRFFAIGISRKKQEDLLVAAILKHDDQLLRKDIEISCQASKGLFSVEVNTQIGDIQKTLRAIKSLKQARLVNCSLDEIGLNEGICLVKGNLSNPIHALVNIAEAGSKKIFLERDAGLTSGLATSRFQDNRWTFNFYENLQDLQRRAGYTEKSSAVKLYLKP